MADKKISELTSLAQGSIDADADVVAIVDTSATETKKATAEAVVLAALGQASAVTIPGTATINSTVIPNNKTLLVSTDVGSTVQAYDADTAKYDDVTANFTGTLQNGGSNVLVDTDIGSTVQAYDADTAKYDDTTANFTGTLQNGGSNVLVDTDIGTNVQAYDADTAKYDDTTANFTGTLQNGGSNVLVDTDIGTNVQAYDADTAKYDDTTANFTGTLQNGGSNVVVDTDIGSTVLAYDSNLQSFVTAFTLPTVDGSADQVLKTDGAGNIGFATVSGGGTPGGSDTQIQYNSSGSFAGASGLVTDGSNLTVNAQGDIRFADSDSSNWIALQAPATVATNVTFTLPNADGTSGQALTTDGSGALSWATVAGSPGGSDTQLQFNSSGSFAGASGLVTDGSNLTINAQGDLRFADSDSSNWVAFQAPATVASNVTWTLPSADGTSGQVLSTNGSGTLSWASGGGGGSSITAGDSSVAVTDTGSNGTATFTLDNTVRAKVNAYGIGLGTETPSSGMGIKFPVTQSASTDANTLDDYEEGTWTGTLGGSVSNPSSTVSATGSYVKIGKQVTLSIRYENVNTSGGSGNVYITGIPFTCAVSGGGSLIAYNFNFNSGQTSLACNINPGNQLLTLFTSGSGAAFSELQYGAGATRYLYVDVTYFTS